VVEEGRLGREPLHAHQFFAVEATARALEADVAFPGNVADPTVIRHGGKPYVRRLADAPAEPEKALDLKEKSRSVSAERRLSVPSSGYEDGRFNNSRHMSQLHLC
jgi:type IV secretory pathway VirB9-like protein